jgi:hypothetical protein
MSDATTHLLLPFILAAQAQKHVTHNEALRLLDGLVQLAVLDRDLTSPPASPSDGDRYIVASGATGDWSGWDLSVAYHVDGAWMRLAPRPGWRAWVEDEGVLLVFDGAAWVSTLPNVLQDLTRLGIGTIADAANPFAAKLNAALWTALTTAEGGSGDLRTALNKESAGNVLSLVLQSGFSARAELGLVASDDLTLKVSPDGATWHEALAVDRTSGIVSEPNRPRFKAYTNYDNYIPLTTWTTVAINATEANDQGVFDASTNRFIAPADGTYLLGASLLYKVNASLSARMRGRLLLNGTDVVRGSLGEISGAHHSNGTALWLQTLAPLAAGDTVELQAYFRAADGYVAAQHTTFWGAKVG